MSCYHVQQHSTRFSTDARCECIKGSEDWKRSAVSVGLHSAPLDGRVIRRFRRVCPGRPGPEAPIVGAAVVGGAVVGAAVVGAAVVEAAVVGKTVVGTTVVVGATVVGATVVGATVAGAMVVGEPVVGAMVGARGVKGELHVHLLPSLFAARLRRLVYRSQSTITPPGHSCATVLEPNSGGTSCRGRRHRRSGRRRPC